MVFPKPLIVADELWAHSICQNAAIYVDRDSVMDIVDKLCCLDDFSKNEEGVVKRGNEMLGNYPIIKSRIKEEIDFVCSFSKQP